MAGGEDGKKANDGRTDGRRKEDWERKGQGKIGEERWRGEWAEIFVVPRPFYYRNFAVSGETDFERRLLNACLNTILDFHNASYNAIQNMQISKIRCKCLKQQKKKIFYRFIS